MLSPTHLRTLVTVVRLGSFADAARHLGYTPSAVSQQVATLERQIRTPLFERQAHAVRPTPTALALADRAIAVLAEVTSLAEDLPALTSGEAGRLRVGSFPTASRRLVPDWFARLRDTHPDLQVVLDEDEPEPLLERLRTGELDVALAYGYDLVPTRWPAGLRRTPLVDEPFVLVLPQGHPLADAETIALADLAEQTWVAPREQTAGARAQRRACAVVGFDQRVGFRSNDYGVVCRLVRAGLGIAVVPALGVEDTTGLVTRSIVDLTSQRHTVALHRAASARPGLDAILAQLVAAAAGPGGA
ncbi:LysR family transcriptional regulator [Agilicoccus flavus]|uniref:LysR family transcriptional regulator n=1 Tax=Agilicoccus flavus TaxID=2775968 RepID=UPI001CF7071E|nr:LysR family transcriptional regulator [Agilicoccus flavus]